MTGEPFFVPFYQHLQLLMSLEPDNILRNIYGVLTGFSCTFIEENNIHYDVKVILAVDPETFLVTPLWANLK